MVASRRRHPQLARLQRMYAGLALEHHALKEVLSRKG